MREDGRDREVNTKEKSKTPGGLPRTFFLAFWLVTVSTRAMALRTTPIRATLAALPPVVCCTRSLARSVLSSSSVLTSSVLFLGRSSCALTFPERFSGGGGGNLR